MLSCGDGDWEYDRRRFLGVATEDSFDLCKIRKEVRGDEFVLISSAVQQLKIYSTVFNAMNKIHSNPQGF